MGILETRNSVCGKLTSEFDNISNGISLASGTINSSIGEITSLLNSFSLTPTNILNNAISGFISDMNSRIPSYDIGSIDDMLNMINSCNFLSGDLSNPIVLFNSTLGSFSSFLHDVVSDLASTIPEFSLGDGISNIMNQFSSGIDALGSGTGLTSGMGNLDKIINCVNALCPGFGSDLASMISTADSLYGALGMVSNPASALYGQFDLDAVYTASGIGADKIAAVNQTLGTITGIASTATTAVSAGVDVIKSMDLGF